MQRHVPFSQRDFPVRALIGLALACFLGAGAASAGPEPGRTDGEEGSEYGKGGYPYYGRLGQFYAEGFFGAAMVDIDPEDEAEEGVSSTDLMSVSTSATRSRSGCPSRQVTAASAAMRRPTCSAPECGTPST